MEENNCTSILLALRSSDDLDIKPSDGRYKVETISNVDKHCNALLGNYVTSSILVISYSFVEEVQNCLSEGVKNNKKIYVLGGYEYPKPLPDGQTFRGPFLHMQGLIDTLQYESEGHTSHESDISSFSTQSWMDSTPCAVWYQSFFRILAQCQQTITSRQEQIAYLRYIYRENNAVSYDIYVFEVCYSSDQAIEWFSKDSFFYRTINKILRSGDINSLFVVRNLINDLSSALYEMSKRQVSTPPTVRQLYRGQFASIDEINMWKDNIGLFFITTSFWSTSFNQEIAKIFAGVDSTEVNNLHQQRVLFTISITDENNARSIYANLRDASYEEEELLVSFRSLFRIQNVEFKDKIWHVSLTLIDEEDKVFRTLTSPWQILMDQQLYFEAPREQQRFVRDLYLEDASTLTFRLLIDIVLLRLNCNDFAKQEMIEYLLSQPFLNDTEKTEIQEFCEGRKHEWESLPYNVAFYKTSSVLRRVLQSSLGEEKVDEIIKLRYFIRQLHCELSNDVPHFIQDEQEKPVVYIGERIPRYELERLRDKEGGYTRIKHFLLASRDSTATLLSARQNCVEDDYIIVIYEIKIDTTMAPFFPFKTIDLRTNGVWYLERFLSVGGVFFIESIHQHVDENSELSKSKADHIALFMEYFSIVPAYTIICANFTSVDLPSGEKTTYDSAHRLSIRYPLASPSDTAMDRCLQPPAVGDDRFSKTFWIVKMTLTDHNDEQWRMLTDHLNTKQIIDIEGRQ
jgi:hypothetical protein